MLRRSLFLKSMIMAIIIFLLIKPLLAKTDNVNLTGFDKEASGMDWASRIYDLTGSYYTAYSVIPIGGIVVESNMQNYISNPEAANKTKWHSNHTNRITVLLDSASGASTESFVIAITRDYYIKNSPQNYTNPHNKAQYYSPTFLDSGQTRFRFIAFASENKNKKAGIYTGQLVIPVIARVGGVYIGDTVLSINLTVPHSYAFSGPESLILQMVDSSKPQGEYVSDDYLVHQSNAPAGSDYSVRLECTSSNNGNCNLENFSSQGKEKWPYEVHLNSEKLVVGVENVTALTDIPNYFNIPLKLRAENPPASGEYVGSFTLVFNERFKA